MPRAPSPLRYDFPLWAPLLQVVAVLLVHGLLPRALAALASRHGWSAGHPAGWNLLGLLPVAGGAALLIWVIFLHDRAAPKHGWRIEAKAKAGAPASTTAWMFSPCAGRPRSWNVGPASEACASSSWPFRPITSLVSEADASVAPDSRIGKAHRVRRRGELVGDDRALCSTSSSPVDAHALADDRDGVDGHSSAASSA